MSLKGINKTTARKLVDLLDQLETLERITGRELETEQIRGLRNDLAEAYEKYELMVNGIAEQVSVYQAIYGKIRFRFVPEKLKSLRRIIPQGTNEYELLKDSIRKSHSA